ncbi:MAG: hypothetical protein ACRCV0_06330 [Brevinema sp.]
MKNLIHIFIFLVLLTSCGSNEKKIKNVRDSVTTTTWTKTKTIVENMKKKIEELRAAATNILKGVPTKKNEIENLSKEFVRLHAQHLQTKKEKAGLNKEDHDKTIIELRERKEKMEQDLTATREKVSELSKELSTVTSDITIKELDKTQKEQDKKTREENSKRITDQLNSFNHKLQEEEQKRIEQAEMLRKKIAEKEEIIKEQEHLELVKELNDKIQALINAKPMFKNEAEKEFQVMKTDLITKLAEEKKKLEKIKSEKTESLTSIKSEDQTIDSAITKIEDMIRNKTQELVNTKNQHIERKERLSY